MFDEVDSSYCMVVAVREEQWAKDPRYYQYNTSICRTLEDAEDLADDFDELGIACIILQHKEKHNENNSTS